MPLLVIIDAPIDDVYNVLNDPTKNVLWNPVIQKVNKIDDRNCEVESFLGKFRTTRITSDRYKEITFEIKDNILTKLSYKLEKITEKQTRVYGEVEFDGREYRAMHKVVGRSMLDNLKYFLEHLQRGLKEEDFRKI